MAKIIKSEESQRESESVVIRGFRKKWLTSRISLDGDWYCSHCPELDIASQGRTSAQAKKNLVDAVLLYFEAADIEEIVSQNQ